MLKIRKFAAIDIGSNAVRLLIANVIEQKGKDPLFKKSALVRVPIRLGADVFLNQQISEENEKRLVDTMNAFRLLMKSHKVVSYKACATSAMREADNGSEVVAMIEKESQITIDVIDGEEEAAIIAATDLHSFIDQSKTYLYVDVGGGSSEFSVIHEGRTMTSKSFKIGTVRLLNDIVAKETWEELESWIKLHTHGYEKINLLGTGGNINKIFKISRRAMGKPLTYTYITTFNKLLKSYSYEERITEMDLNQDRADVIVPAMRIYIAAMKWSNAKSIYVPKIGLSDGIIKSVYFKAVSSQIL